MRLRQTKTCAQSARDEAAAGVVPVDRESQLLVDDFLVARADSVFRRVNRPRKERQPFLLADREWEGSGVVFGCVVPLESGYRLYYRGLPARLAPPVAGDSPVCVAHSADGLTFSKAAPRGALVRGTNIVLSDALDDFTVLRDPDDPDPRRRFKLLASRGNWRLGLTPAVSRDGIRWTWGRDHAVAGFGDRCSYWYDPLNRKHVAWSRNYQLWPHRVIVQKETADFDNWSDEQASPQRLVLAPDRRDHEQTQFYGGCAFWYRSLYLAYLEVYYVHQQRIDTQLACSRDGRTWTRIGAGDVFLGNGEHGEFDAYWAVPTFNAPILKDGQLLIHYNGRPDPHAQPGFRHVPPGMGGAFGLATLREDGFVSLDATGAEGIVETKPLQPPSGWSALEVNCCPFAEQPGRASMDVRVELLDRRGKRVSSVALGRRNSRRTWHHGVFARRPAGVVRLRFRLTNARLYSFRFR
jgi:hypothetical protein